MREPFLVTPWQGGVTGVTGLPFLLSFHAAGAAPFAALKLTAPPAVSLHCAERTAELDWRLLATLQRASLARRGGAGARARYRGMASREGWAKAQFLGKVRCLMLGAWPTSQQVARHDVMRAKHPHCQMALSRSEYDSVERFCTRSCQVPATERDDKVFHLLLLSHLCRCQPFVENALSGLWLGLGAPISSEWLAVPLRAQSSKHLGKPDGSLA